MYDLVGKWLVEIIDCVIFRPPTPVVLHSSPYDRGYIKFDNPFLFMEIVNLDQSTYISISMKFYICYFKRVDLED